MYYGHPPDYEAPPPYGLSETPEPVKIVQETDPQFIERIRNMVKENKGDTDRRLDKLKQDMTLSHAQLQHQLIQLQTIEKAHLDQKTQETIRNIMLVFEDRFNILERDLVDTIHSTMAWLDTIPVLESRHAEMSERIKELIKHVSVIQSQFREMDQFVRKNELIERIQSLTDSTNAKEQDIKRMLIQHITEHENQLKQISASNEHVKRQLVKHIEELSEKEIKHQEKLYHIEGKLSELDLDSLELREKNLKDEKSIIKRIEALEEREEKNSIKQGRMEEKEHGGLNVMFYDSNLSQRDKDDLQSNISILMDEFKNYKNTSIQVFRAVDEFIIKKLFNHITTNNETIFLKMPSLPWYQFIVITDKNVYYFKQSPYDASLGYHAEVSYTICVLYTFNKQLNYASMLFLINNLIHRKQIFTHMSDGSEAKSISDMCSSTFNTILFNNSPNYIKSLEKFEQIIRIIPGSFKNGDWVALDGFFGLYFNQSTYEILDGPVPFEFEKTVTVSSSMVATKPVASAAGGAIATVKKREKSVSELMLERMDSIKPVSSFASAGVSAPIAEKEPYKIEEYDLSKIEDIFGSTFLFASGGSKGMRADKASEIAQKVISEIKKSIVGEKVSFVDYTYSKFVVSENYQYNNATYSRLNYLNIITNKGNIYSVEFLFGNWTGSIGNMVLSHMRDPEIRFVKKASFKPIEMNWKLLKLHTKKNGIQEEPSRDILTVLDTFDE